MDTMSAFLMGEMNRHKEQMVFDWDKAARLIAEKKPKVASAGLRGDWEYTGGVIYAAGEPIKNCSTFLASTWAVPELALNGWRIECFRMQHEVPGWNAVTAWPDSALAILEGSKDEQP